MRQWKRDTPYIDIVQDLGVLLAYEEYKEAALIYDMTGLGNVFQELLYEQGLVGHGVTITGGEAEHFYAQDATVPKATLVTGLIAKLETGQLTVHAEAVLSRILKRQIAAFTSKRTESGHVTYGGRREHDDLVLALSLACWGEKYTTLQIF